MFKDKKVEVKKSPEKKSYSLKAGEKIKLVKGETPHYDRTEAPAGIMVGKVAKFI